MTKPLHTPAKASKKRSLLINEIESLGNMGIYQVDLTTQTFTTSPNFRNIFGLKASDRYPIIEFSRLVHPEDHDSVINHFEECLQLKRDRYDSEYRCLVKDRTIYVRVRSNIYYNDLLQPICVIGIKQDVTDKKLAELATEKQKKKIEQINDTVGSVVHDLRAPLINMKLIGELLRSSVPDSCTSLLDKLEESFQRANSIIDDVLMLTEISGHNYHIIKDKADMLQIVNDAVSMFYYAAKNKNIKIVTSLEPKLVVTANHSKLQSAVENLLSNAIKFSHEHSVVEVNLYSQDSFAVIEIADHGIGMDLAQQKNLFKKSAKLRRKGTNGEPTNGLGLHIVERIVQLHGGKIEVNSQPGQGTKVKIFINM